MHEEKVSQNGVKDTKDSIWSAEYSAGMDLAIYLILPVFQAYMKQLLQPILKHNKDIL